MPPVGRPRQFLISHEELYLALATASIQAVARRYGVSYCTIWRRCKRLRVPHHARSWRGTNPRGRVFGSGQIEAAIRAAIAPGQWYDASALRRQVPGSRQRFYEILARLCAEGTLERRGRFQAYEWAWRLEDHHGAE